MQRLALTLTACVCFLVCTSALIHEDLRFTNEQRGSVFIEEFSLVKGGHYSINISNFQVFSKDGKEIPTIKWANAKPNYGILMRVSRADVAPSRDIDKCPFQSSAKKPNNERRTKITGPGLTNKYDITKDEQEGIYQMFFINCDHNTKVSFKLHAEFYHVMAGGVINHLQAGEFPLPAIYIVLFFIYTVLIIVWVMSYLVPLLKGQQGYATRQNKNVKRLQILMTCLFIFKALSLLCRAIEFHYLQKTGKPKGWNIPYYIFTFINGTMLFLVFLLIGTDWAFIKPYLSERDKKLIMIIIPLQILANIAYIIVDETSPSWGGWIGWKQVFQVVDLICSVGILIPIIWSIKHLKEAEASDGKAAMNINKMRLFRQFYLTVVVYIYFTRIIILLLDTTLPFYVLWLSPLFFEMATLIFFCITGWNFRPTEDNSYFQVPTEESVQMRDMTDDRNIVGLES